MISIIIPIFNGEKYVQRCIDSVLKQSHADFELIIVDDGSRDSTGAICNKAALNDSRIKVLHIENGGVSNARNLGLKAASGEYITFIDGDDFIPDNYLSALYKALGDADISCCDISCVKEGEETRRFTCKETTLSNTEAIELLLSRSEINSGPCGKLFSKSVVAGLSFPPMKAYEDILFVLEAFKKAKTIVCTNKTKYVYDNGTGGAMTGYAKHPTTDVVTMSDKIFEYLDQNKNRFSPLPEYTTLSHLMQHLQEIGRVNDKTEEQKALSKAIVNCFKRNRKRIKSNKQFSTKEKYVYLFAARGFWITKGLKRI